MTRTPATVAAPPRSAMPMYPSVGQRCARTPCNPLFDQGVQALGLQVVGLAFEEQAWISTCTYC